MRMLLALQKADFCSKGVGDQAEAKIFDQVAALLDEIIAEQDCLTVRDLAVNGRDLMDAGMEAGPRLGDCLDYLLTQVQEDKLPNEKDALLEAARRYAL